MHYLGEDAVLLTGHLAALHGPPDAVVAPLHQPPLELDGVAEKAVIFDLDAAAVLLLATGEGLELAVELGVAALGQEEEEVEAGDLVALLGIGGGAWVRGRGDLLFVEGLQRGHVPREAVGVARADAEEGAGLVDVAGLREFLGRGAGGGR